MAQNFCDWDIKGKVCIVTGANCGLGRETCLQLVKLGAGRVILACRNVAAGEEAVRYIRERVGMVDDGEAEKRLAVRNLDLASLDSVRKFAAQIKKEERELHVLINNAGVYAGRQKSLTSDGFELTFGTNHLGHFLLTNLLLDLLKKSAPARVVVLASVAHVFCWPWGFHIDDPNYEKGRYQSWFAYCQSKLANMLFVHELDKRLNAECPSGVTAYSLHPGAIQTPFLRNRHWLVQLFMNYTVLNPLFSSTIEQGVMTTIHCATKPDIEKYSGKYFANSDISNFYLAGAEDDVVAKRLWELSEHLTNCRDTN